MRFSVNVPNFGEFADPEAVAVLAQEVEHAGWDALFVWDHLVHEKRMAREIADPWILLAAAAMVTSRIRLGTLITPVARRRPQKLAREVTSANRWTTSTAPSANPPRPGNWPAGWTKAWKS
jgi:alkanesulfonate monooxygenase SsuD/methylene tetrahydromethanopterin reductase-like flavin-dependent oxidoreductase (luciferase family)